MSLIFNNYSGQSCQYHRVIPQHRNFSSPKSRRPPDNSKGGLSGIIDSIFSPFSENSSIDTSDIILLLILLLLYLDSKDEEFLIILIVVGMSVLKK